VSTSAPGPSWFILGPDLAGWMRSWWPPAPQALTQPILPGWTFALNNVNSTAPQTEVDVVAKHSYGRQIGRLSDVVTLLLGGRDDLEDDPAVIAFQEMKDDIDTIKTEAAGARLTQIRADLATLKARDNARYQQLRAELLHDLDQPS
jgi:hypothetical protein